jgi:riboflavin kinase/FMN adenylyltransferase
MKVVHSLDEVRKDSNSVVTVGTFDGVHLGHQEILRETVRRAKARRGRSVCFTFDPHPKEVVGKGGYPVEILTTMEERILLFEELGFDLAFVFHFTYEFSRQTPKQFYEKYLVNGVGIAEEVEGYDHMFGRDREGGIEEMKRVGNEFGFTVAILPPFTVDGEVISSTKIRHLLREGDVGRAARYLGRPYTFDGTVVKGVGRGAVLGFPTANLEPISQKRLVPKDGVYFVRVVLDKENLFGMLNIGNRPTFETDHVRIIEVNLFDFDQTIYGKRLRIQFLQRIRDEVRFASAAELVQRMQMDRAECLKLREQFIHNLA